MEKTDGFSIFLTTLAECISELDAETRERFLSRLDDLYGLLFGGLKERLSPDAYESLERDASDHRKLLLDAVQNALETDRLPELFGGSERHHRKH